MGPAVRDLSRELHFRFLGLAKYLRSRQKGGVLQILGLACKYATWKILFPASTLLCLGGGSPCLCESQMQDWLKCTLAHKAAPVKIFRWDKTLSTTPHSKIQRNPCFSKRKEKMRKHHCFLKICTFLA